MPMKNTVPSRFWTVRIAAQARIWTSAPRPRRSILPSSGALIAWVSGTPNRAGPIIATD